MQRGGSFLEKNVARLFKLAGFELELNKKMDDYEIDVFLQYKTIRLGIECKQYERSSLAVRNLIHEWDSKNKELRLDKILLVLVGCEITDKDRDLAKKYGITIWNEEKFDELFDEVVEKRGKLKNKLLMEAGLGTADEITEQIRNVKERFGCPEWMAIEFLRNEISPRARKKLDKLPRLPENVELSKKDFRKFIKNSMWYGIPFKKIVEVMARYDLKDKEIARILVAGHGRYDNIWFNESKINKIMLLMDELGLPFSKATRYSKRNLTTLRGVIAILKSHRNVTFGQALRLYKKTRRSKKSFAWDSIE